MFDFLKKKIGGFIDNLTKGEGEEKAIETVPGSEAKVQGEIPSDELPTEEFPIEGISTEGIPQEDMPSEASEKLREEPEAAEKNTEKFHEAIPEEVHEAIHEKELEEIREETRVKTREGIASPSPQEARPPTEEPEAEGEEAQPESARAGPETDRVKLGGIEREAAEILAKEAVPEPAKQAAQHPEKGVTSTTRTKPSKEKAAITTPPEIRPPEKEIPKAEVPARKPSEKKTPLKETEGSKSGKKMPSESEGDPKIKEKERVKLGVFGALKGLVTGEVEISESEVTSLLDDLELELLEADVELSVANIIREELKAKLARAKVKRGALHEHVGSVIRETLVDILTNERDFDLVEKVKDSEKPFKIVFLGINGAGKTTTMAKVARLLMDNGLRVNFAAADTFRAAAIEQLSQHGERLNVRVVKRDYGSDPTSVAYDAVNYAKAHSIDAVLIDTAGRQDTNISLINEMKKMGRVIKPDLKIYIGESISGNAIIEQISSFNREIGIDGVILTKLDCDPKGGTMLSISKATGIPILYLGVGQAYSDLERFDPETIAERITS